MQQKISLKSSHCSCALMFTFHPQPFLGFHELPDTNRDFGKQFIVFRRQGPVCFAATAIIIHASTGCVDFRSRYRAHVSCSFFRPAFSLGHCDPGCPVFHLIPVVIPDTVNTATHAAVVRFLGLGRNGNSVYSFPRGLWRNLTRIVARGSAWTSERAAKNDRHSFLGRLRCDSRCRRRFGLGPSGRRA